MFARLLHKGLNVYAVFERWILTFCARVLCALAEPLTHAFVFLRRKDPHIEKQANTQISSEKAIAFGNRSAGSYRTCVPNVKLFLQPMVWI